MYYICILICKLYIQYQVLAVNVTDLVTAAMHIDLDM